MAKPKSILLLCAAAVVGTAYVVGYHSVHTKAEDLARQRAAKQQTLVQTLDTAWQEIVTSQGCAVDVALYDHVNGETAHYTSASGTFNTASIVKLSILENTLLQDQRSGTGLTADQLAYATPMIENSDNDAATALWDMDGGTSALNDFFQTIGATTTSAGQHDYWGLTQTTALDQLKVVNQISYPRLLNANSVQAADNLLDNVEADQSWGVSGGVPAGVSVELKNGWLQGSDTDPDTWDINSIGHIHGDGQDYAIVVLTKNDVSEQAGINLVQALSAATWSTLAKA